MCSLFPLHSHLSKAFTMWSLFQLHSHSSKAFTMCVSYFNCIVIRLKPLQCVPYFHYIVIRLKPLQCVPDFNRIVIRLNSKAITMCSLFPLHSHLSKAFTMWSLFQQYDLHSVLPSPESVLPCLTWGSPVFWPRNGSPIWVSSFVGSTPWFKIFELRSASSCKTYTGGNFVATYTSNNEITQFQFLKIHIQQEVLVVTN